MKKIMYNFHETIFVIWNYILSDSKMIEKYMHIAKRKKISKNLFQLKTLTTHGTYVIYENLR